MANYIRLKWWNSCDLGRVYYQDNYKNIAFFEADVIKPDFENEEEGFNNGDGVFVKTLELLKVRYKFELIAPEYIAKALKFMALHDNIQLSVIEDTTTLYQTTIRNVQVSVSWDETFNDCFALIEVSFEQDDQVLKNNCCYNLI